MIYEYNGGTDRIPAHFFAEVVGEVGERLVLKVVKIISHPDKNTKIGEMFRVLKSSVTEREGFTALASDRPNTLLKGLL